MTPYAAAQKAAIEEALRERFAFGEEAERIHVYGPKLYGTVTAEEHICTRLTPFEGAAAKVVFHVDG